jgi:peptidylprolyl isomerase
MNRLPSLLTVLFLLMVSSCKNPANQDVYVSVKTSAGTMKLKLYSETPLHKDNFIRLVNSHFYDGIPFHRVIDGFMIQAGDESLKPGINPRLRDSLSKLTVKPEFRPGLFHKRGALAAAREGNDVNPEMLSSATQFYIVQGKKLTSDQLTIAEQTLNNRIREANLVRLIYEVKDSIKPGSEISPAEIQEKATLALYDYLDKTGPRKITEEQKNIYINAGGVPRLDGTYTVFGEVVEGFEVIDKIAAVKTDATDKPLTDVVILKMKIVRK